MPNFFKDYSNGGGHLVVTVVMLAVCVAMMYSSNNQVVTAGVAISTLVATAWITPSVANMAAKKAVEKTSTTNDTGLKTTTE